MREDTGNYRPVNLASVAEKIMVVIILGTTERHLKNDTVIRNSQYGFRKEKSQLTVLISFYNRITCLLDEGKAVDTVFQDFSRLLILCLSIFLDRLFSHRMNGLVMHWVKNWPKARSQRIAVNAATAGT